MTAKTALIVDDSRTARAILRSVLVEQGFAVNEVSSAEAALEHLSGERPDVVFLDHMMPGMDGFEALEAIKANPETVTIPVMMYTSQEGRLYLSQARALGAVGVLPKSMAPADIGRVLRSLHLVDEPDTESEVARSPAPPPAVDTRQLGALIRELLYDQTAMLREELREGLRRHAARTPAPPLTPLAIEPPPRPAAQGRLRAHAARVVTGLSLAMAFVFAYLYFQTESMPARANDTSAYRLTSPIAAADAGAAAAALAAPADDALAAPADDVLATPAWRRQLASHYAFGAIPLDDAKALEFGSLLADLERRGFTGAALIEIHAGRFCMNYAADGTLRLAPPEQPAATCERIGMPEPAAPQARQSITFANMLASATREGRMRVETHFHGTAQPIIDYPSVDYSITAGDWNSIAASNQRVTLRLVRETRESRAN